MASVCEGRTARAGDVYVGSGIIPLSSVVEQLTVNQLVIGSNPVGGDDGFHCNNAK